jgi:hypothetical protein
MRKFLLILAPALALTASGAAQTNVSPHPGILWAASQAFMEYDVEIATDADFKNVVARDRIANVSRHVPARALEPGAYHWRALAEGRAAVTGAFQIDRPSREIRIPAGSGMDAIRAALAEAREQDSTRITFEPGEYHLHPGNEGTLFEIVETENLILDAQGAKFILHEIAGIAEIRSSRHITLRNFTVDYETPVHTAAKVESIARDGTMVLSLWPGCAPPESSPRFMEEKRGMFYDPRHPRMAEDVPLLVHMAAPWKPLGGGRYSLRAARPAEVRKVRPGMVYICAPRNRSQGFEIRHCGDVTLADVTTLYQPGIGVASIFCEDLKLIRLNLLRRNDRLLGGQNGGTNLHNARIGPWVEGCRFENTGDDCNHISAMAMTAVSRPDARTVRISPGLAGIRLGDPDLGIRPGDRLAFFNREKGARIAEAAVTSATLNGAGYTEVRVDRDLPEINCGGRRKSAKPQTTQIFNLSQEMANFVFRNNTFLRGRRIGILAKGGPGLIENNGFLELGGGGVEIFNAPYEGLHGHRILIRNNLFRRGGLVARKHGAAPAIWTEIFDGAPSQPLHRDIRITGNRIVDYPGTAIHINDTSGLVIADNRFDNEELETPRDAAPPLIRLDKVHGGVIGRNRFEDRRFAAGSRLVAGECSGLETRDAAAGE